MSASAPVRDQSAAFALLDLIQGSVITQALHAVAQLGIADILGEGPLSPAEIATRAESDPRASLACSGCSPASVSSPSAATAGTS